MFILKYSFLHQSSVSPRRAEQAANNTLIFNATKIVKIS